MSGAGERGRALGVEYAREAKPHLHAGCGSVVCDVHTHSESVTCALKECATAVLRRLEGVRAQAVKV